jgi:tetratricopeptide (TPR) repeat protein
LEQLDSSGQLDVIRTSHARYYIEFLIQSESEIKGGREQKKALDKIEADFHNIQAAWDWTLFNNNMDGIDRALETLYWFCKFRNRQYEGVELYLNAEAKFAPGPDRVNHSIWRRIATRRISLDQVAWLGEFNEKLKEIKSILIAVREEGDLAETAYALVTLGQLQSQLNLSDSLKSWEESQMILHKLGDKFSESWVLDLISMVYLLNGQLEERVNIAQQRLEIAKKSGDMFTMADAVGQIGFIVEMWGRYKEAEANYTEVLPVFRDLGDWVHTCEYIYHLGRLALLDGDIVRSKRLIAEGQVLERQFNIQSRGNWDIGPLIMILIAEEQYSQAIQQLQKIPPSIAITWIYYRPFGLAYAMCGMGNFEAAKPHLWKAIKTANDLNYIGLKVQCLPAVAIIAAGNNQLERATELLSLATHHPARTPGLLEIIPLVTQLRTRLDAELTTEVFNEAWERGKNLDLDEVINTLLLEDTSKPTLTK